MDAVKAKGTVTYDGVVHRAILAVAGHALAEETEKQHNGVVAREAGLTKKEKGKAAEKSTVRAKNGVYRIINALFLDESRKY